MSTQALAVVFNRNVRRYKDRHIREVSSKMQGRAPEHTRGFLDSWKEIAAYLGREVRTVQRWERREGLPVHRHVHVKACTVYAFKEEIDTWLKSRAKCSANFTQLGTPPASRSASRVARRATLVTRRLALTMVKRGDACLS